MVADGRQAKASAIGDANPSCGRRGERHPDLVVQPASVPPQGAGMLGRPDAASQALSTCLRPAGHFAQTGQILQIGPWWPTVLQLPRLSQSARELTLS